MEQTILNITSVGGCFKISVLVTKCVGEGIPVFIRSTGGRVMGWWLSLSGCSGGVGDL